MIAILSNEIRIIILNPNNDDGTSALGIADIHHHLGVKLSIDQGRVIIAADNNDIEVRVNESPISGAGPVALDPYAKVTSGGILWTAVPAEWFWLEAEDVAICGRVAKTISYASQRSKLPVIDHFAAFNMGNDPSVSTAVSFDISPYADAVQICIPAIEPNNFLILEPLCHHLNDSILRTQSESAEASLTIGFESTKQHQQLTILPVWDWSYAQEARSTIAAFVLPRDPQIERLVLDTQTASTSLIGVLKRGEKDAESSVARAIYDHLFNLDIMYEEPSCLADRQSIRPPSKIFNEDHTSGSGTCLDFTLLFAGCFENIGLCPLVIFFGAEGGPMHALLGYWTSTTPGFRPVIRDVHILLAEVEAGNLMLLECTGIANGARGDGEKLSFDDATRSAETQLSVSKSICAVDIAALRPPFGNVVPLRHPLLDPVVAKALVVAKEFAFSKMSKTIETVHLVYGLLAVEGRVTTEIFDATGVETARSYLSEHIPVGTSAFTARPTKNYRKCISLAEQFAELIPGSELKEEHLWWAIFETRSSNVIRTFEHLRLNVSNLQESLKKILPNWLTSLDESSMTLWG